MLLPRKIAIVSAVLAVIAVCIFLIRTAGDAGFHYAYYNNKEFYGDLGKNIPEKLIEEQVYGGILSHHLYAAPEFVKFFANLKLQRPKTVVLIGPNHDTFGYHDILISKYAYKTPWGVLEPDLGSAKKFLSNNFIKNDEKVFERENSISAPVSYVKYFFPEAKLMPIILKRNTPRAKLDALVDVLNKTLPNDVLVLASVDFSHHVNETTAEANDKKSISAIRNFNCDAILASDATEIDSPPSIYVLLKYLEGKSARKMTYANTNSAIFGGNMDAKDVTSYVFASFTKGAPD